MLTLKDVLKNATSLSNEKALTMFKTLGTTETKPEVKQEAKQEAKPDDQLSVSKGNDELNSLHGSFNKLNALIEHHCRINSSNVSYIVSDIANYVKDYKTAIDIITKYNLRWFQIALLSEDDKVKIADQVLTSCYKFTKNYLDFFRAIVHHDPIVLEKISGPDSTIDHDQ